MEAGHDKPHLAGMSSLCDHDDERMDKLWTANNVTSGSNAASGVAQEPMLPHGVGP